MKTVHAQFVRSWEPARGVWLLCVVLLVLSAGLAGVAWQTKQRRDGEQRELDDIGSRRQQLLAAVPQPKAPAPMPYDASARDLLAQSAIPWPALLGQLEATSVQGVRLVRFEYVAAEARARVEITFANQAAALMYVNKLAAAAASAGSDGVWRWQPLSLTQPRPAEPGSAVLDARWQAH